MRRIRVFICSVDDETPDEFLELAGFDLPVANLPALQPETALDDLETTTYETGNAILRRLFQAQWETVDERLTEHARQQYAPQQLVSDGYQTITVASRFGTVELSRRVCYQPETGSHHMPGNAVLPPHNGIIITRGLQEWACFTP